MIDEIPERDPLPSKDPNRLSLSHLAIILSFIFITLLVMLFFSRGFDYLYYKIWPEESLSTNKIMVSQNKSSRASILIPKADPSSPSPSEALIAPMSSENKLKEHAGKSSTNTTNTTNTANKHKIVQPIPLPGQIPPTRQDQIANAENHLNNNPLHPSEPTYQSEATYQNELTHQDEPSHQNAHKNENIAAIEENTQERATQQHLVTEPIAKDEFSQNEVPHKVPPFAKERSPREQNIKSTHNTPPAKTSCANKKALSSSEQTLLKANSKHYTVQILALHNKKKLDPFLERSHMKGKVKCCQGQFKGKPWYMLVYGDYATREEAQQAIAELPFDIQKEKPWVRTIASVQDAIHAGK